jgi:hypothetical protein
LASSLIPDETTDMTTSHLTNPASEKLLDGHPKDAGQVIGYSHSTRLSAEELLIKPLAIPLGRQKATAKWLVMAGHPKDDSQVAGYSRAISTACVIRFA